MMHQRGVFLLVGVLVLSVAGCGEPDPVGRTFPVKGKVTVNGEALKRGSVAYLPDESKGNTSKFSPSGDIGEDGTYELKTRNKPGAPPGAYKVIVVSRTDVDSTKPTAYKNLVPPIYSAKDKTPLEREVKEGAPAGAYDLDLK